jgi:nitrite reductase/ring-hydroxylating ferredoxin subunit
MHGAEFDIKTGEAKSLPATKPLEVYKVLVSGTDENATVSIEVGK